MGPVCIAQNPYANLTVLFFLSIFPLLGGGGGGWARLLLSVCVFGLGFGEGGRAIFGTSVAGKSFAKF